MPHHCRGQQRYRLPSSPSRQWSETPGRRRSRHTPRERRAHSCWVSPGRSQNGCKPAAGCVWGARWKDACLASWAGWSPSTAQPESARIRRQKQDRGQCRFAIRMFCFGQRRLERTSITEAVAHFCGHFHICFTDKMGKKGSIQTNSPVGGCYQWPCCTCHRVSACSQSFKQNKLQD